MKYKSLNDAAKHVGDPGFAKGQTRIWYVRPEQGRDYRMGYDWLRDQGIPVPDPKTIGQTHIKLGSIKEADLDRVFSMLQGESWSPRGEARDLIRDIGLGHTSISVGDIVQTADGELLMVDSLGFRSIHKPRGANPFVKPHKTLKVIDLGSFPHLYEYADVDIEVTEWPRGEPTEWRAVATDGPSVISELGEHEVLRALKIKMDLIEEAERTGPYKMVDVWDDLHKHVLPGMNRAQLPLTLANLEDQVTIRILRPTGATHGYAYRWLNSQPPRYQSAFLQRAIDYDNLLHGAKAPSGVPARGRPRPSNPTQTVVNPNTRKRRLLR